MAVGFCPQCGTPRQGTLRYCANCGFDFWAAVQPGAPSSPGQQQPIQPVLPSPVAQVPRRRTSTGARLFGALVLLGVIWIAIQALGSGGSSNGKNPGGGGAGTIGPPSTLDVSRVQYTKESSVGGSIEVIVTVSNGGSSSTGEAKLQFSDLDQIADIVGCTPQCSVEKVLGTYATLPSVPAGATATWTVEWVATKVGARDWTLCVYEPADSIDQVYCGGGTTVVR